MEALGFPLLARAGYEADDLIATLVRRHEGSVEGCVVVSGDKDLLQLVSDRTVMVDTMKERRWGPGEVRERYGVGPEGIVEVLGLMGDASDNVPGVPGIGEKTAVRLLKSFGTIEGILGGLDRVAPAKLRGVLADHAEQARLSRRLCLLEEGVPLDVSLDDLALRPPDVAALRSIFAELEFTRLLADLPAGSAPPSETQGPPADEVRYDDYHLVLSREALDGLVGEIASAGGPIGVDTETTSPRPTRADLVGISIATRPHRAHYIPLGHDYLGAPRQLGRGEVLAALRPFLEDPGRPKVGQNLKYDWIVLARAGVEMRGIACDTMLASYVLDPSRLQHNLAGLSLEHLNHRMITYEDVTGRGKSQKNFREVEVSVACRYSCEDADVALLLAGKLLPRVDSEGMGTLYRELDLPLLPVLGRMEMAGVRVDPERLRAASEEMGVALRDRVGRIHALAGGPFNVDSPVQLRSILFEKLGLRPGRRGKTGFSTDSDVLEGLARQHELPRLLLDYRRLSKLRSTYTEALLEEIDPGDGRIHASFNQTTAATGRLSASEPNLQNIPIRTEEGRRIRRAFVANPGCRLLSADYSQIELRVLAHLSRDPMLVASYRKGEDVHARTAAEVFGVPADAVTPDQRRRAKAINFGIVYGMGAWGLSRSLEIEAGEAQEFIRRYFERYAGVKAYVDATLAKARERGYVETLMGRRRLLPEIRSSNPQAQRAAERMAVNTTIQGTAADLIKRSMLRVDERLAREAPGARMILQVHDELVFEAPQGGEDRVERIAREEMEGAATLDVPLVVALHWGSNWDEAH